MNVAVLNQQGEDGSDTFDDTSAHVPAAGKYWKAIYCLADATFTLLTDSGDSTTDHSSFTMSKGETWFGKYTAITLATGAVKAFK